MHAPLLVDLTDVRFKGTELRCPDCGQFTKALWIVKATGKLTCRTCLTKPQMTSSQTPI